MSRRRARDQASRSNRNSSSRKPLQRATVTEKARKLEIQLTSNVDKTILDRIQKCLDRAHHANTSEAEAKAALFVSQRLMSHHNVSQVDLIASDDNNDKGHFGAQSIVRIKSTVDRFKRVVRETFVGKLAQAMGTLFDCRSFSTDCRRYIKWTFYGIASNTVAAAMSFEMAHNKILEWACAYKGGSPSFCYCLGIADGLMRMANREKKRELDEAQRKELDIMAAKERKDARERRQQLDGLLLPPAVDKDLDSTIDITDVSDDDDDDDDDDGFGIKADFDVNDAQAMDLDLDNDDLDKHIERLVKREQNTSQNLSDIPKFNTKVEPGIKKEPGLESIPEVSHWESGMQLVRFRRTAEQVADDYLKLNNIKLRSGRKQRPYTIRDQRAYRQGQKDSAKIKVQYFHSSKQS